MNRSICTISTLSHLFKAYALAESLRPFGFKINVLVVDEDQLSRVNSPIEINLFGLKDITSTQGKRMIAKYSNNLDKLRWGLKSVFLAQLLKENDQIIYCDNDVHFFKSPEVYFQKLETQSVLLTPHYYKSNPNDEQNWLEANYRVGLYNAGFIGVNKSGVDALIWWENCCLYNIKKSFSRGLFDDQKYLDLLPVIFDNVKVIKTKTSNLAGWNFMTLKPKIEDVVFVHFAELTMREFQKENNPYFKLYGSYIATLRNYKPDYLFKRTNFTRTSITTYLHFVKWKISRVFE